MKFCSNPAIYWFPCAFSMRGCNMRLSFPRNAATRVGLILLSQVMEHMEESRRVKVWASDCMLAEGSSLSSPAVNDLVLWCSDVPAFPGMSSCPLSPVISRGERKETLQRVWRSIEVKRCELTEQVKASLSRRHLFAVPVSSDDKVQHEPVGISPTVLMAFPCSHMSFLSYIPSFQL
ncbi:unnamed protein product [Leuciscus chuanchicus]